MRRGVLFSALGHEDRGYLYLTMRVSEVVRSVDVGRIIVKLLAKLKEALKSPFVRKMETFGFMKARQLSRVAVEWGYITAHGWANETWYIRYLTNNELNTPSGYGMR